MVFLDFEVFEYDWLVVLANSDNEEIKVIINNPAELMDYYNQHKQDIFAAYNMRGYDQFIFKAILAGFNPKLINDWIIVKGKSGYSFSSLLNNFPMICYDVMVKPVSLKVLEGFMGKDICELKAVSFDVKRKLTEEEIKQTIEYCKSDVSNMILVFVKTIEEFKSHLSLIHTFNLPATYLIKTKAQLSAEILECVPVNYDDEWEISFIDTLQIKKYAYVIDWFKSHKNYNETLETLIAGVPHIFAWGGLHGAREKYHGKGLILHVDVNSFYPAIMIEYGLLSRAVQHPEKYRMIRDKRIEYKKTKNPLQAPYKIVLNSTYGICKDKHSKAFDPRRATEVCVNGQLLLLDLIEHLEAVNGFELIQSNTDGLIIKIPDTDEAFNHVDDICYEWEKRCKMGLSFDFIDEIWQKDVNGYVFRDNAGELERKGGYVKLNNDLDNDLPIINEALVNYMVEGIPLFDTITNCTDMVKFQKLYKVSSKYTHALTGCTFTKRGSKKVWNGDGRGLTGKVFRVFATKDTTKTALFKQKALTDNPQKFANCPEHAEIVNEALTDVPAWLDKQWYIDLAEKRLADYGV